MRTTLAAALLAAAVLGCTKAEPDPAPPSTPAPVAPVGPTGPVFDNPEYANWKRFPVGTSVRRRAVTATEGIAGENTITETFTLKEVTDKEAVVERQNTTERGDGVKVVNPPDQRRIPRQFPIPAGMTADDFRKPSRNATAAGDESVVVLGKPYTAAVFTWSDSNEGGPLHIRLWLSEVVPGRVARQEMTAPKLKAKTVEEVVEIRLP